MKLPIDCIPCFLRHAVDAARRVTQDTEIHERALKEALLLASFPEQLKAAPQLSQRLHRRLRALTGIADPYEKEKIQFNELAISLLPQMHALLKRSQKPFDSAVRIAIAGNIIDVGAKNDLQVEEVLHALQRIMEEPFSGDLDRFRAAVSSARKILYLADNAGEIVFDRLLIEQLSHSSVTVAVRGAPILNDATLKDAQAARLDEVATVIDNGSDAPGTLLEDCSEDFQRAFAEADLIVSKGQGNFETLCDSKTNTYFLLKIKCPVVSSHTALPIGTQALIAPQAV